MTAQSVIQSRVYSRPAARLREAIKIRPIVRKDLLVTRLMIAAGLGIPALMVFHILSPSFVLIGVALGLMAVGGVMALIRCGEVA